MCSEKCRELVGSDRWRAAPNAFRNPLTSPKCVLKCARSPKNVHRSPKSAKRNPKSVLKNANLSRIMQARALAEICPEIRDRVPHVTSTPQILKNDPKSSTFQNIFQLFWLLCQQEEDPFSIAAATEAELVLSGEKSAGFMCACLTCHINQIS